MPAAPIRILDDDQPPPPSPSAVAQLRDALESLGIDADAQAQLADALGSAKAVEAAAQQVMGMITGAAGGLLGGPSYQEVEAIDSAVAAHKMSADYCRSALTSCPPLPPTVAAAAIKAAKMIAREHGEGIVSECGHHRSMLLPSGIVLHYQEWGKDSAPPIILLHDINECRRVWYEAGRAASSSYHVLALDLRGHGETSRSPRRHYALDDLCADLDHLVVDRGLNGKDMAGEYTRPWTLAGRGLGAAVATAYAAAHPGRVSSLLLYDFDPSWRRDRLGALQSSVRRSVSLQTARATPPLGLAWLGLA